MPELNEHELTVWEFIYLITKRWADWYATAWHPVGYCVDCEPR